MMRIHFYEADNVLFPVIPFKNYRENCSVFHQQQNIRLLAQVSLLISITSEYLTGPCSFHRHLECYSWK